MNKNICNTYIEEMIYNHSNLNRNIKNIKTIFKTDKSEWNEKRYNDKLFDYLIVNKNDTNEYSCGNLAYMTIALPTILSNEYDFSDNEIVRLYEVYCILTKQISIDNYDIYEMKEIYKSLKNNELEYLPVIKIKNKTIDFNKQNKQTLNKYFNYCDKLQIFLSNRFNLKSVFLDYNMNIYYNEPIIMKKKYDNVLKRTNSNLLNEIVNVSIY